MNDPALALALETRLLNAWPSFEYQFLEGWVLRFAGGYSKRANSASPIAPGARLDEAGVEDLRERFLARNIRPIVRLTGLQDPAADGLLAARGFAEVEPTWCLACPLDEAPELDVSLSLDPEPGPAWVRDAAAAYGGDKADDALLLGIVRRIRPPAAFATLDLDGRPVAWGLGVCERGYVGLYDIVVAPDLRGLGLGRRVVAGLMSWGMGRGARLAYLQVREENRVAIDLYRSMGFREAYRYTHRIMEG